MGRKMPIENVDSIAQGRVWSGEDALRLGLIDGYGDVNRAIASASKLAKLKEYQVVTYPEPADKFEMMFRRFKGSSASAEVVKAAMEKELGSDYEILKQMRELKRMNGKTLMALPFGFSVK
jgi:protease-4